MERLKKGKQKKQNRGVMKKSILRIAALLLVIGLNWTGLLAIGRTLAYFSDTENSLGNVYQAGTLDFSLFSSGDFFPSTPGEPNQLIRDISVIKEGSLGFQYQIKVEGVSGELCPNLRLTANLNDGDEKIECPTNSLAGFSCGPFETFDTSDDWRFTAFLPEGFSAEFFPESCEFKLIFEAWQTDLAPYLGFSDIEEIENKITKHYSEVLSRPDIVINEFLPDPIGNDSGLTPNGEWVELYNRGNSTTTLTGWYLSDLNNNQLFIPTFDITPKGFLVVYLNGAFSLEWLNNDGDMVFLWAPKSANVKPSPCFNGYCLADVHFFTGSQVVEGKSFARIPDGSNIWYDPDPTPGAENQLSEEEIIEGLQPEVIELDQEELFQQFMSQFFEEPIFDDLADEPNGGGGITTTSAEEETIIQSEEEGGEEEREEEGEETSEAIIGEAITDGDDGNDEDTESTDSIEGAETNEAMGETSGENTDAADVAPTTDSTEVKESAGADESSEGSESSKGTSTTDGNEGGSTEGGEASESSSDAQTGAQQPASLPSESSFNPGEAGESSGNGGSGEGTGGTDGADASGDTGDSSGENAGESSGNNGDAGDSAGNSVSE